MRRRVANAVVVIAIVAPLWAAGPPRGGARTFAAAPSGYSGSYRRIPSGLRTPPASRQYRSRTSNASLGVFSLPPVRGTSLIDNGQSACLLNPSFSGSYYCRQYYPSGAAWGAEPVYPYWLPSMGYDNGQEEAPPAAESEPDPLTAQVGNLAAEVEMLRQDRAMRDAQMAPPTEPPPTQEELPPTTLLVYRDGHQVEVQNYAIQGNTLWVFGEQRTRQVPLSDLDLAATERVNDQRGVEFSAPSQR